MEYEDNIGHLLKFTDSLEYQQIGAGLRYKYNF